MEGDGSLLSVIIVLAVLLLLAAYFAVSETSIASVSKVRIKIKADRGDGRAKKTLWVLDNFDRAITTILIGTNIVHITAATIVTVTVTNLVTKAHGDVGAAVTVSTFVTTLVVFFAGEMLPKSIAKKYSETLSLAVWLTAPYHEALLPHFRSAYGDRKFCRTLCQERPRDLRYRG